jgi:hypothetical protein
LGIKRNTGIHFAFVCHECFKALDISKTSSREQIWVTNDFFLTKRFQEALSYQLKMLKSTLNRGMAFAKKLLHL